MSRPPRKTTVSQAENALFTSSQRKSVPYEFVLDAMAALSPRTRPMFGCLAVYVREKIVLILRDKRDGAPDNGVWLATTQERHESLRRDFPNMRSIQALGKKITGWQILPADAPDFEEAALRACELIAAGDPRIGKTPGARRTSKPAAKKPPESEPRAPPLKSLRILGARSRGSQGSQKPKARQRQFSGLAGSQRRRDRRGP